MSDVITLALVVFNEISTHVVVVYGLENKHQIEFVYFLKRD